jgi:hypothetical protein
MSEQTTTRRRFGKIEPDATDYSGLSRASIYNLAGKFPELFRKHGSATLVDFSVLDTILDGLPVAKIKPPPRKPTQNTSTQ